MTLPGGVFIALGILSYIILWRYILLKFFELVKPSEDHQDCYPHETESNLFNVLFSSCSKSSYQDQQESCQIIANISPEKQSVVLNFKPLPNRVLEEVEHFGKTLDAHKPLKLCLRLRIGRWEKSMVTETNKSRILELRDMQVVDDDAEDTQRPGNPVLRDIAEAFDTSEVVKCDKKPLDIKPNPQLGREEKDLNTMIRRLVAAELIKCCEKEHGAVSRAHSDTNNRVNWKRNRYNKQPVNLDVNSPSFGEANQAPSESICDTDSPESTSAFSSLSKKYCDLLGKGIQSEATAKFVTENVVEVDEICESEGEDDPDDKGSVESVTIVEDNVLVSCKGGYRAKKSVEAEDVASIEESEEQTIGTSIGVDRTLLPITMAGKFEDVSTQTEHMYMIRAVRSCPSRRRRLQLLGAPHGISNKARYGGKVVPAKISFPGFLHRKASDNLIYEKGKGSRSPSYVPVPERFRWRYVTPTKVSS